MSLLLHDEEIREEGIAKGIAKGISKGKIAMIQSLIEKGQSKEFILTLDCSEEEYKKAEEMLHETVLWKFYRKYVCINRQIFTNMIYYL